MQTTDPEIALAIVKTIAIGSGSLNGLYVNDKLVHKKFSWKSYLIVDCNYGGIIADNKIVAVLKPGDKWRIDKQEVNGTCINGIDSSLIKNVEEVKERTAKKNKVINL